MMKKLKAILFDMDGVLINSMELNSDTKKKLLTEYNIDFNDELALKCHGHTLKNQVNIWNKEFKTNINPETFTKKYIETQDKIFKEYKEDYSELIKFIQKLKDKKIEIAIGTSSNKIRAENILKTMGIFEMFDVIITNEDVSEHKPNPDVYLKAASKLNIKAPNCLVIEDSKTGIQAAKNAKMKVVGCSVYNKHFNSDDVELEFEKFDEKLIERFEKLFENDIR